MDHLLRALITILSLTLSIISACHALLWKRDPRSALGWVVISLILPIIGPLLYWSMGINRINRKARQWLALLLPWYAAEGIVRAWSERLAAKAPGAPA